MISTSEKACFRPLDFDLLERSRTDRAQRAVASCNGLHPCDSRRAPRGGRGTRTGGRGSASPTLCGLGQPEEREAAVAATRGPRRRRVDTTTPPAGRAAGVAESDTPSAFKFQVYPSRRPTRTQSPRPARPGPGRVVRVPRNRPRRAPLGRAGRRPGARDRRWESSIRRCRRRGAPIPPVQMPSVQQ